MKRLLLIIAIISAALTMQANYTLYSFSGNITVLQGGKQINPQKGMKVNASDQIEIAPGAKVEIYNAATKEIFSSSKSGKNSVMGIMLDARRQASKTAGAINDRMRFSAAGGNPDTRLYTEGLVKRSMQVYDPGAESLVVEPRALALHIANALRTPQSLDGSAIPVPITHSHTDGGGIQFRVENSLGFPVYLNVLKIRETALGSVEISELGQPMGCYVVLPGQSIAREHFVDLNPAESHILIMTHCRFDIDELIEQINKIFAENDCEQPDPNLPVYLRRLYIITTH